MSDIYIHSLSPFAIQFTEAFGIRWYGLSYLAGFVVAYFILHYLSKKGLSPLPEDRVSDFITFGAIGTLVGGRLGYCLFYSPDLFFEFSSSFPFWGALEVHKGGMASHGGIAGLIIAVLLVARHLKFSKLHALDITGLVGGWGIFFGRMANYVNGELYGREAPASFKWAVKFPQEMYRWISQAEQGRLKEIFPAVEKIGPIEVNGLKFTPDLATWNNWVEQFDSLSRSYIGQYVDRLVLASQHGQMAVMEALGPALTARYPSQIYQGLMEGLAVFLILLFIWRKPQKPGVVSAWFGVLYAVARTIGEQFRMPDAHIGYEIFGLTRGQILSVAMFVLTFSYLVWCYRRKVEKTPGWRPAP